MNTKYALGLLVAVILIGGGVWAFNKQDNDGDEDSYDATGNSTTILETLGDTISSTTTKLFTLAEIMTHSDATSCFTAIDGNVYNLTAWIPKHPGGEKAILGICGKDGSAAFNRKHGGAEKQALILATFKLGVLAN